MDFKGDRKEFIARFRIAEVEKNPVEEFRDFKQGILNFLENIDYGVSEEEIIKFCSWFRKRVIRKGYSIQGGGNIYGIFLNENNPQEFYFLLETIFTLQIKKNFSSNSTYGDKFSYRYNSFELYSNVMEIFSISDINASIMKMPSGKIIIYPRGEEVLDQGLVEEVFGFLDKISQEHFISAIKHYKEGTEKSFIKSAENIRRCLEEFLRFKLKNDRGLDKNIMTLLAHIKDKNVAKEIRNIVQQIFSHLDKYFNEKSKHNDGDIGEPENEFLLYQSGLLMRYINKVII